MPSRRLPNSVPAVLRVLKTARDTCKNTAPADRALTAEQWAQLDETDPVSFLNRLLKEASDIDLALAAQAPLTTQLSQTAARLTMVCSHFHQVLDLGIARGAFAAGARSYYGRDVGAAAIPDLTTYDAVDEAAAAIVTGEAARQAAEGAAFVPMALRTPFRTARTQQQQALVATDREREELGALYPAAQALATDICDTVEFFSRKDPDAASRRAKASRWGVVYFYDTGEPPAPDAPPPTPPPAQ